MPSPEDKIINGLQVMATAHSNAPPPTCVTQLEAIANLQELFVAWHQLSIPGTSHSPSLIPQQPRVVVQEPPRVGSPMRQQAGVTPTNPTTRTLLPPSPSQLIVPPRLNFDHVSPPRVVVPPQDSIPPPRPPKSPIAHRTRSRAPLPNM